MLVSAVRMLAFVWLSVSLLGGPAVVLCQTERGHTGIELAHGGACASAEAGATNATAAADRPAPSCDDEAVLDDALRVERSAEGPPLAPPPLLTFLCAFAAPDARLGSPPPSPADEDPPWHLTPLASVVLHL